ncbi:hypothetical protein [Methanosarcina sp.]|uniref:hypothetical protein n=1 Tax=Methanosarcina sp. TaxID=2213 RepID=UPI003C79494B
MGQNFFGVSHIFCGCHIYSGLFAPSLSVKLDYLYASLFTSHKPFQKSLNANLFKNA